MANKVPFKYAFLLADPHAQLAECRMMPLQEVLKLDFSYPMENNGPTASATWKLVHYFLIAIDVPWLRFVILFDKDLKARFSDIVKARELVLLIMS
jgi:hypothetical protein